MKWGKVLSWLWAVVTASCLLLLTAPFAGLVISVTLSLIVVTGWGLALRWSISKLSRELL